MEPEGVFNPLDKYNLGRSVVDALLLSPEKRFADLARFSGAGVYAIYYRGDFEAYHDLSRRNKDSGMIPIYVGKAIPKGGRKGTALDVSQDSIAVWQRLQEHAESIKAVGSLVLDDFTYRSLIVDDVWIPLGNHLLFKDSSHFGIWSWKDLVTIVPEPEGLVERDRFGMSSTPEDLGLPGANHPNILEGRFSKK
jgi:hypothetical protein